jgi:hypothetical protein
MKRNIVPSDPRPAKRRWQPIRPSVPGWERDCIERWKGVTAPRPVPRYTGPSRLRAKLNDRIRKAGTA